MPDEDIRNDVLVALVRSYEQNRNEFMVLPKQTLDSSSTRLVIAELRNQGTVEEQVRGVIRLTALGYKKYKSCPSYACAV